MKLLLLLMTSIPQFVFAQGQPIPTAIVASKDIGEFKSKEFTILAARGGALGNFYFWAKITGPTSRNIISNKNPIFKITTDEKTIKLISLVKFEFDLAEHYRFVYYDSKDYRYPTKEGRMAMVTKQIAADTWEVTPDGWLSQGEYALCILSQWAQPPKTREDPSGDIAILEQKGLKAWDFAVDY
jgi:hypothetical protein